MNKFIDFMEGPRGRTLRIVFGLVLAYVGLYRMSGTEGAVVALAAAVPIVMGLWGPCLVRLVGNRFRRAGA